MRHIVSLFQTPITRTFAVHGTSRMGIASISAWTLDGAPLFATKLWPILAEELGAQALDVGVPKSYGEVLVHGNAYAPAGLLATTVPVRVQLGAIDKRVHVIGDRHWTELGPTEPAPFDRMPLTWERAFGGEGFAANPAGKGIGLVQAGESRVHPLPNLERPGRLITFPRDRPAPTCLAPIDLAWAERFDRLGTYDLRWYEERFPGFADDIDWRFFNVASRDQQIDGMWRGDESFVLEGVHPERSHIAGRLPGVGARAFVTRGLAETSTLEPVAMRLSTVWFVPHRDLMVLVHHGAIDVARDDGTDVGNLVSALEWLERPKLAAHYAEILRKRLDPEWGALHALRDADLMPEGMVLPKLTDADAGPNVDFDTEDLLRGNLRRKAARGIEVLRERLRADGLDPDEIAPRLEPEADAPIDLDELPAIVERAKKQAEEGRARAEEAAAQHRAELERKLAAVGLDAKAAKRERPMYTAAKQIELLTALTARARAAGHTLTDLERRLQDPAYHRDLLAQEGQFREAYRVTGHHWRAVPSDGDDAARLRAHVIEHLQNGWSLAEQDLIGADLSNLDLRGVDLRGAWLEAADLQCADLTGTDLRAAILTRADLSDATLNRAQLAGANLGEARLLRVRAPDGIDLRQAVLAKADLRGALLPRALLADADLSEAHFDGTELSGIDAPGLTLWQTSLQGTRLAGANLAKANFLHVALDRVDFSGARLEGAVFLACTGESACFAGANLTSAPMVEGCAFEGANFRRALLDMANLRGARLTGADFTEAILESADLSEAELTRANFYRAVARRARFVRADLTDACLAGMNLMEAILQEATLHGTDLRGANLFAADMWKVESDARTDVRQALVKRTRFVPKGRHA